MNTNGYTLIEVLVSLSIFLVALAAQVSAVRSIAEHASRIQQRRQIQQTLVVAKRLSAEQPQLGTRQLRPPQVPLSATMQCHRESSGPAHVSAIHCDLQIADKNFSWRVLNL